MNNLPLVNISNTGRNLILFCRDEQNNLIIDKDCSFFPYYYEEDEFYGKFTSYNNKKLKQVFVSHPAEIKKQASSKSWENDIHLCKRYLIDKISEIKKANFKYSFIDIEVLAEDFPNPEQAKYPISVISSHNSYTGKITTFYLGHYNGNEEQMIEAFIKYLQKEQYDLLIGWNLSHFDYPYLTKRIKNFSQRISPIGQDRWGVGGLYYPAGTSIIDYMDLDIKMTLNRKRTYSLEARSLEVVGHSRKITEIEFGILSEDLILRCENDVKDMIDMEQKLNYLPLIDSLRRLTKTEWESCLYNSHYIDALLLDEGRKKSVILPNNPEKGENTEKTEGAFRIAYKTGRMFNVGVYDLSAAYLNAIIELNLDPMNICETPEENTLPVKLTDRKTNDLIKTCYVKQNKQALLPALVKTMLVEKNKYKELKNITPVTDGNYSHVKELYEAYKGISLSAWGVICAKFFRYYDYTTSSLITSIPRDLLHYIKDKLENTDYKIIFIDTDGMVVDDGGENIVVFLNSLIAEWSLERFGKKIDIIFDYEGHFIKLFLKGNCHYKGLLRNEKGEEELKIKGIELKKKDSNAYIKFFQTNLIDKILDNCSEKEATDWILNQIVDFKNTPVIDISFPCKLSQPIDQYKTQVTNKKGLTYNKKPPIFVQALQNSKLKKRIGSPYYYIYTIEGVMAFDDKCPEIKSEINWNKMIDRNIILKAQHIYDAMGWDMTPILPQKPLKLNKKQGRLNDKVKGEVLIAPEITKASIKSTEVIEKEELLKNTKKFEPYYSE